MWSRRRQRKIERMRQEESNRRAALEAGPGKPGPSGTIPQRVWNKKSSFSHEDYHGDLAVLGQGSLWLVGLWVLRKVDYLKFR